MSEDGVTTPTNPDAGTVDVSTPEGAAASDGRAAAIKALTAMENGKAPRKAKPDAADTTAPAEAEAAEAPAAEAVEATEVKTTADTDLKARLRARNAAIDAREREFQAKTAEHEAARQEHERAVAASRAEVEAERAKVTADREAYFATLRQMAKDNPSKFLEENGIDLTGLVRGKLQEGKPEAVAERAIREAQEARAELRAFKESLAKEATEREAKASEERAQRQQFEARAAQEKAFLDLAKPDNAPILSRMAKKNPAIAMQNAYLISGQMQRENGGKLPTFEALVARVESELRTAFEEDETPATAQATTSASVTKLTPKKSAGSPTSKPIEEMTEAERRREAIRVVNEMQRASTNH